MRRSLILLAALLLLSAGVFWAVPPRVDAARDAVTIEPEVRYGDPSAAEGLTLGLATTCDGYLHWSTAVPMDAVAAAQTAFTFTAVQSRSARPVTEPYLNVFFNHGFGISGTIVDLEANDLFGELTGMIRDVAERTPAGEIYQGSVPLADYFDDYPLTVDAHLPDGGGIDTDAFWSEAGAYFRIPVPEDQRLNVTIQKDTAGNVCDVRVEASEDVPHLNCWSVVTDQGVYLVLSDYSGVVPQPLDSVVDGYGVYYLPFRWYRDRWGNLLTQIDNARVRRVFAIDLARAAASGLDLSPDGTRLLLRTVENGSDCLTVIDLATMEQVQKLTLFAYGGLAKLWLRGNCIAALDADQNLTLWALEDGRYRRRIDANLTPAAFESRRLFEAEIFYDGSRLVLASYADDWMSASVDLAVCTWDGLAYAARYWHSQDRSLDSSPNCRHEEAVPSIRQRRDSG